MRTESDILRTYLLRQKEIDADEEEDIDEGEEE